MDSKNFDISVKGIGSKRSRKSSSSSDSSSENCQYLKIKIDKQKVLQKIDALEKQIKILQDENSGLKRENFILRTNNIKFQIEIFNLQQPKAEFTVIDDCASEDLPIEELLDTSNLNENLELIEDENYMEQYEQKEHEFKIEVTQSEVIREVSPKKRAKRKSKACSETYPYALTPPSESQTQILGNFDIQINATELYELNCFDSGMQNDQKFINKLLCLIFDKKELALCSVTGKPSNNQNYPSKFENQMDPKKKSFIKAFLEERLSREENLSVSDRQDRVKRLNYMIRSKINNLRKHIIK